jgi:putative redox protein
MPSERISFFSSDGIKLAGVLEKPDQTPLASAVFAHCFTCSKDLKATVRVSRQLASLGFLVLRFDFRGIGDSLGQFEDSNFQTNVVDLRSAIDWLAETHQPPRVIIGHSLGGAAAMSVAARAASAESGPLAQLAALVTLAAPSNTSHLANFLSSQNADIEATGVGDVSIGGKAWPISTQLIDSLRHSDLETQLAQIRLPHLILHSPEDATVAYHHAQTLLQQSGGLTSLISLDGSDHLLVKQKQDVAYVAKMIATWASRYV